MVTGVFADTGDVVTVKLANPRPAGTSTIGGTRAAKRLLVASVTDAPPAGALAFRKTVPLTLFSVTTPPPAGAGMTSSTVPRAEAPPINPDGLTPIAKRTGAPGVGSISSSLACIPPVVP